MNPDTTQGTDPLGGAARPVRNFLVFAVVLVLGFSLPLLGLVRLAWKEDLFSHVLLIPFIAGYLVWLRRGQLELGWVRRCWGAVIPLLLGLTLAGMGGFGLARGWRPPLEDYLALMTFAFYSLLVGGGLLFLGGRNMRVLAFPAGILVFIVPFPVAITKAIEWFFQHTSADAAHALFGLVGQTLLREGLMFHLPGMSVEVAEECSGIRSSLVLFMTSLLAGHLFLRSPWRRAALTVAVIPLGILRNGFRIFTIAMLSSHVDPDIIRSPLHTRGGPLFFLLSLVPFFLLLVWLRKSEQRRLEAAGGDATTPAPPETAGAGNDHDAGGAPA
jgi:exosortase C (VPDSG-CTERM-specific)